MSLDAVSDMDDQSKTIHNLRDQMHVIVLSLALGTERLDLAKAAAQKATLLLDLMSVRMKAKRLAIRLTNDKET